MLLQKYGRFLAESEIYATHLYHDAAPISIAILFRSIRVSDWWSAPPPHTQLNSSLASSWQGVEPEHDQCPMAWRDPAVFTGHALCRRLREDRKMKRLRPHNAKGPLHWICKIKNMWLSGSFFHPQPPSLPVLLPDHGLSFRGGKTRTMVWVWGVVGVGVDEGVLSHRLKHFFVGSFVLQTCHPKKTLT